MPESRATELAPKVHAHLLDCWLHARGTSLRDTAISIGELRTNTTAEGAPEEWVSTALRNLWRKLEADGILIPVPQMPRGREMGFNFSGRPLSECSLRTMLQPYLEDSRVSSHDKSQLKTGLRKVLPQLTGVALEGTKTDEMVLVAASRVGPDVIPVLPGLLRELGGKGEEYARLMRNCMRHAMEAGHAVVLLPALQRKDPWALWMDEHALTEAERRACLRLQRELEAMTPEERGGPVAGTPDDIDAFLASRALQRVLTVHGQHRLHPVHRKELLRLGERGLGPFRDGARIGADLVVLADGKHPSPAYHLHSANPEHNAATWPALLATLKEHHIAPSMIEFVEWVRDFSTLSDRQLKSLRDEKGRKRFPARRQKIEVELGAEVGRIRAFRAYLGAARNIAGIPAAECTDSRVFGTAFEQLTDCITEAWEARVAANKAREALGVPMLGVVKHDASTGLHGVVAAGGVIALLGFDRSTHARGAATAQARKGRNGKELGINLGPARLQKKTSAETAYLQAYEYSRIECGTLAKKRGGAQNPTHKIKEIVYADTPLCDLMPGELAAIWKRIRSGRVDPELPFDALRAFAGSIVATGQVRIEELAHMRRDRQLSPAMRAQRGAFMGRHDRKDDICEHEVAFNDALQPAWLLDYVFDVAIPALGAKWTGMGNAKHQFVFMDANGRPFGDPNESDDGTVRNQRLILTRKGKLMAMFKDFRCQALVRAGLPITNAHGTNTGHAERGRMANIATNLKGVGAERAGRLLGHLGTQGENGRPSTAERSYSRTNLEANRETLHDVLLSREWYRREHGLVTSTSRTDAPVPIDPPTTTAPANSPSLDEELAAIYARAEQFQLKPVLVNTLVERAMKKWDAVLAPTDALRLAK